jgi:hypothetical protein
VLKLRREEGTDERLPLQPFREKKEKKMTRWCWFWFRSKWNACNAKQNSAHHFQVHILPRTKMSLCSRAVLGFSKASKNLSSRQFGALTHKSWSADYDIQAVATARSIRSEQASPTADSLLDSLFSRHLPLPHGNLSQMNSGSDITFKANSNLSILDPEYNLESIQTMARNSRHPKKANKGARPCSRISRRKKKEAIGKRRR